MQMQQQQNEDRSLGDLFNELSQEFSQLVREEVNLAKAEVTQKASAAGKDVGFMAAGGAVAYIGVMALVAGIIIALGHAIPLWLSAIIVGLLVAGGGYLLVQRGMTALKQTNMAPEQTIETLKEDATWIREQAQ
jgi:uncharacterized membrane protein YqjE